MCRGSSRHIFDEGERCYTMESIFGGLCLTKDVLQVGRIVLLTAHSMVWQSSVCNVGWSQPMSICWNEAHCTMSKPWKTTKVKDIPRIKLFQLLWSSAHSDLGIKVTNVTSSLHKFLKSWILVDKIRLTKKDSAATAVSFVCFTFESQALHM